MWAVLQVADTLHGMNCECHDDDKPGEFNAAKCPYIEYLRHRQRTTNCQIHDS